jgi:hypothetical protein
LRVSNQPLDQTRAASTPDGKAAASTPTKYRGVGTQQTTSNKESDNMQRLKLIVLALASMLTLGVLLAGTAAAVLPTLLNAAKELVKAEKFEGTNKTNTELQILKGKAIKCEESISTGELVENELGKEKFGYLGPFHITFNKCSAENGIAKCTGEGDAAGTILVLGETHLVFDSLSPLGAALLFLISPRIHITCEAFSIKLLILVEGKVLCLITPLTLAKEFTIKCERGAEPGDPGETKYWDDAGNEVNIAEGLLSADTNEKTETFVMSSQLGEGKIKSALEVELMD